MLEPVYQDVQDNLDRAAIDLALIRFKLKHRMLSMSRCEDGRFNIPVNPPATIPKRPRFNPDDC